MARVPEVLVVDQDPKARFEVKSLVKQVQLSVVGEAGLGTEAVSLASDAKPDVVVCGMSNPPERSLQTIEALLDVLPETPVIAYGWQDSVEVVRQAMLAGAKNFLSMPADSETVLNAVRSVLEAEERKRLRLSGQAKALGPRGLSVTVFGAKGGVGKSTVSTNLSVSLASQLGQSVVLVDGDNSFGDVAAMLDLRPDRTILDLVRDIDTVERSNITDYLLRHRSGLFVLAAPRDGLLWRTVQPEKFRKVIGLLARRFDVVIVDTAGSLNDLSLAALEEANIVLWVTSSDFSSINNSVIGLDTLRQLSFPDSRVRLMLNVIAPDDSVRATKIEEVLGRKFFWSIPYDRQVRLDGQVGNPAVLAHPESRGAKSISELAQVLMGTGTAVKPAGTRQAPLRRLFTKRGEPSSAPAVEGS